jgi:hypothetical protein
VTVWLNVPQLKFLPLTSSHAVFDMYEGADDSPGSESGCNEHVNELSGVVKGGKYFGQLRGYDRYKNSLIF